MKKQIIALTAGFVVSSLLCAHEALGSTVSTSSLQQNELAIRLGAMFPNSANARIVGGTSQLSLGLDYTLDTTYGSNPSATNAYFDYFGGTKDSGYLHSGGIGLAYRTMGPSYIGAGLGIYNTSVRLSDGITSANKTGGGGKVFIGTDLGNKAMIQLDYHVAPSVLGTNPSGVGVQLGFRL